MFHSLNTYILFFTLIICPFQAGFAQWFWQQPLPTGNQLNSVKVVDAQTVYAAGGWGTVIKTTNGGMSWLVLPCGTTANFYSVYFSDVNNGMVVGDSGLVFKTTDGGTSWTRIFTGVNTYLSDVDFPSANLGYIAGGSFFTPNASMLNVLDPPRSRAKDPQTSYDAAASMKRAATAQAAKVLATLRVGGSLGAEQIADPSGLDKFQVCRRPS